MIYKNLKNVAEFISDSKNIDFDIVKSVLDFYWTDVVDRIKSLEIREVYVNKLGSFRFRNKVGLNYIETTNKIFNSEKPHPMISDEKSFETMTLKVKKIEKLLEEYKLILEERIKLVERKYAYRNIQEQNANLGRTKE